MTTKFKFKFKSKTAACLDSTLDSNLN